MVIFTPCSVDNVARFRVRFQTGCKTGARVEWPINANFGLKVVILVTQSLTSKPEGERGITK